MEIELNVPETKITGKDISVETGNTNIAVSEDTKDLDITYNRKEYSIIGDGIFISSVLDDVPEWLGDLIDSTFDAAILSRDQNLVNRMEAILTALDYVPKNKYTEQINQIVDEDGIINTRIATLNSNLTDALNTANATIAEIDLTYASKDEAAAISTNVLTASLSADGEIGSTLIELQTAYANLESTTAESIILLESIMEGEINGNASAMQTLRTYVGIDSDGELVGTGLLADVSILQKQNDGVIETTTGTYDVMVGIENPNTNIDNDQLLTGVEPYASWTTMTGNGIPVYNGEMVNRVYKDITNTKYYIVENSSWVETTEAVYTLNKEWLRSAHVGDVYIKYTSSTEGYKTYDRAYKFIKTVVDETSPYSTDAEGYTWALIVDTDAQNAYVAALNAYDLADDKRRVFVDTPVGPYEGGDLWIRVVGGSTQIWRCILAANITKGNGLYSESDWAQAATDDNAVVALSTGLANGSVQVNLSLASIDGSKSLTSYIAEEIDKEVVVFSGTDHSAQTGMKINDIFIEKTTATGSTGVVVDVVNTWKYSGSAWVQISNNNNLTKLADLTDGKRTIYSGSSLPSNSTTNPLRVNDLFIPTSTFTASTITYTLNEMYRYTGSLWEKATRYDEIKSLLSSQIDNKIETTYGGAIPPFANKTNAAKDARGGDYWYCDTDGTYSKGKIYKYLESANGSKFNYTWTYSSDISKSAFDLADKKRIIFGNAGNSVPTIAQGLALSDIWIPSSSSGSYVSGKVYKCTSISPITFAEVDYTNDEVVNGIVDGSTPLDPNVITIGDTSTTFFSYLSNEMDKKVAIYSGETLPISGQPSGVSLNDIYLWFTTASKVLASGLTQVYDITRTYKYSGSVWNEITTDSNITALADLADGKRTVFSGSTVPTTGVARDVWIPSANVTVGTTTYVKGEIYQYSGTVWVIATKYSADITALNTNLQNQIDSKVETYYQSTVPTGMTASNNGDYWYCTLDIIGTGTASSPQYVKGMIYKYTHSNTSWSKTADVSRYAFDVADGKAAIFLSTSTPTAGYKINDILIVIGSFNNGTTTFSDGVVLSSNANRVSGFTAGDWVKKINDTEDLDEFVSVIEPKVTRLKDQVDGKIEYYFQKYIDNTPYNMTGFPTGSFAVEDRTARNGDVIHFTNTTGTGANQSYYYSNTTNTWNIIEDATALLAIEKAAEAKSAADGVVVSFYAIKQDTAPTTTSMWLNKTGTKVLKEYKTGWINVAVQTGDTLIAYDPVTKDMSTYVYNGSGWITNTENGIVAGSEAITTLTANLSTTNTTVSGHTTQLNTVDTRIANGVAAVETKWAYNSLVNINGASYQSGFGLATSLTSGSGLPTGASEFWIKADKFKLMSADGGKKSSYSPFSVDATTGDITFNGKVTFSSISDSSTYIPTISSVALAKSDAIDYANTAISKLKGINLVPEKYSIFSGTALPPISIQNGTIDRRVDSAYVKYGSASLMTWTTARDCYVYLGAGSSDYNVKVPIGVSIIISIYVKPAWTDVNAQLYIRNSAGDHFGTNARVTADMWNRISLTHTTVTDSLIIRVDNDSWDELGSTSPMAIDGVMVEVNDGTGIPSEFRVGSGISAASWQSEVQAAINNNATTIDGAKITTGTINTNRLNVNDIMAKDMTFTGKITGGSGGLGGIIKSYNNKMTIDLVNGSIYIA